MCENSCAFSSQTPVVTENKDRESVYPMETLPIPSRMKFLCESTIMAKMGDYAYTKSFSVIAKDFQDPGWSFIGDIATMWPYFFFFSFTISIKP